MSANIVVRVEPFDDHGEPDAEGLYEYAYAGERWFFTEGGRTLVAHWYDDEDSSAISLSADDLFGSLPLLRFAIDYAVRERGVSRVSGPGGQPFRATVAMARSRGVLSEAEASALLKSIP